jgi:hypothetical protein
VTAAMAAMANDQSPRWRAQIAMARAKAKKQGRFRTSPVSTPSLTPFKIAADVQVWQEPQAVLTSRPGQLCDVGHPESCGDAPGHGTHKPSGAVYQDCHRILP